MRDIAFGAQSLGELDCARRIDITGLRLEADRFLDQVALGLAPRRAA